MTKIIDADGHIVEPRTFWQDYIEPRFRDRLPRIAKDSDGIDRIAVGDRIAVNSIYAPAAMCIPGGLAAPELMRKLSWDDLRPGSYDPHARLQDMDAEGIDVSVLFPSLGIGKAATALGVDEYLMWASDYPHYDCQFPGAVEELREHCAALPADSRHKIMGTNAARCYGLM